MSLSSPQPIPPIGSNASTRRYANASVSQSHKDITDDRYRDLRRSRKVKFFVNGDRYFKGKKLYITPNRYFNFNDLLNDLTGKLPNNLNLPYGVRQIFTPHDGQRITDIEDMNDGQSYVCAGFEGFKGIKYGKADLEPWSVAKAQQHSNGEEGSNPLGAYKYRGYASNNAFHPGRYFRSNVSNQHRRYPGAFGMATGNAYLAQSDSLPMKPKVVTIVRNGSRPRNNVRILLNRRSVQSFEQLMADVSEAFGPKWKNNKVRRLYTMKGREVQSVSDFFRQDDVFVGVGVNETLSATEAQDIFEELYPDSPYAKNFHRNWERAQKKNKHAERQQVEILKDHEPDKRDSGFGESSDGSNSNRESDHELGHGHGRKSKVPNENSLQSPHGKEMLPKIDKEKGRGGYDDEERTRKRHAKMVDSERRVLEEEKRKRGLVPPKPREDPFKRMKEREKERIEARKRREHERKKLQEMEEDRIRQKLDEAKARRQKELEDAEKAARQRQLVAEKEEQERLEAERKAAKEENKNTENVKEKSKVDSQKLEVNSEKDKDEENLKEREKDKENEKPPPKKRSKLKIVRKTKSERQIDGDDYVLSRYDLGRTLGDGNFAIVRQSKSKITGQEFAMKVIDKPKLKGKEHMVENEIEIMKDCNHQNIVKLYEEYETDDKIYLVMELVKGGDLFDAITQSVKFGEVDSANMVKDLCSALFYLHSREIVHRDLKPENLLVHRNKDGSISLKLADFGLAMEVKESIYTVCGTPTYVAPEILSEIGYGLEVDMWAVGVITYILLCGFPPFRSPDRNQTELFEFIKAGEYEFLSPYWDNISHIAKDLIHRLLIVDKKKRYTSIEVLSHPWIVLGGDSSTPRDTKMEELRRNRRKDLELQGKQNLEGYLKLKEKRKAIKSEQA